MKKVVSKAEETTSNSNPFIGKVCIIRTYSAGVHFGEVIYQDGEIVDLKNARRIWSWEGAFTLSEVSQRGIQKSSRLAMAVPLIRLTGAIELIPCSKEALDSFKQCHE